MAKYDDLKAVVQIAGFFTNSVEDMGDWDRIVVANKRTEYGLGGNSFWITLINGKWYLGTWGGLCYSAASFSLLGEFVIQNLAENHATVSHFDPAVCARFNISLMEDDEFYNLEGDVEYQARGPLDLVRAKEAFQVGKLEFEATQWYEGKIVCLSGSGDEPKFAFQLADEVIAIDKFDRVTMSTDCLDQLLDAIRKA